MTAADHSPDHQKMRVAFQGEPGAFSEEAAVQLLGEGITTVPRPTFDAAFRAISDGLADALLAPVENTLAGPVVRVYDLLLEIEPSPVVRLNRALAIWRVAGAEAALRGLDQLATELDDYHIYHAARGELLSEMGNDEQARAARLKAHDLTHNQAEQALLRQRLLP